MSDDVSAWYAPVARIVEQSGGKGGYVVRFPEYRPDLVQAMATMLGVGLRDFRQEVLATKGWQAGRVTLAELDAWIDTAATDGGFVAQNVEALLAAKTAAERRAWLGSFVEHDRPAPVVLPITVFTDDLPGHSNRVVELSAEGVPELTLLRRLLG